MNIAVWIDNVDTPPAAQAPPVVPFDNDKENARPVKTKRLMNHDADITPRPNKRRRDFDGAPHFAPPSPAPPSESSSVSASASDVSLESHQSGRLSPTKQLMMLEDLEEDPVVFCSFDDTIYEEPADVFAMRCAAQRFADGVGILGYDQDSLRLATAELSQMDQTRLGFPWAIDPHRNTIGTTPDIAAVQTLVHMARRRDRNTSTSEDQWNAKVQLPLLELALSTSKHKEQLTIENVKTAKIEPKSLARDTLPRRVVDYVIALEQTEHTGRAWGRLRKHPEAKIKSWNHTSTARRTPFAVNIETKSPTKAWTDGKPQIAIWTDAWFKRLSFIGSPGELWPAVPLLIAQGHEWHLLVVSKSSVQITIWEQVAIGSTRTCFDALKVVAVLHWLMEWAETVWRPWLLALADQPNIGG